MRSTAPEMLLLILRKIFLSSKSVTKAALALQKKSQRQKKWASWAGWTPVTSYRGKRRPSETGSGGQPGMSCRCPLPPWLQVSWKPLEIRKNKAKIHTQEQKCLCVCVCVCVCGEGGGRRGCDPGRAHTGSFVLRAFIYFFKGWEF